jgi:hypothetical protein
VLLEVNAETDFVAKNDEFKAFVKDASKLALKEGGDLEKLLASPHGFVQRAADPDRTGRQDRREYERAPRRRASASILVWLPHTSTTRRRPNWAISACWWA